jgi:hypothetical protein
METKEINSLVDHNRWLLNNGIMPEVAKNNLFMYGSIAHKDVRAVEVEVDSEKRSITYILYLDKSLIKTINTFKNLLNKKDILSLWRLKRILNKHGNLDLTNALQKFVKDYCGPKWTTIVDIKDVMDYKEQADA